MGRKSSRRNKKKSGQRGPTKQAATKRRTSEVTVMLEPAPPPLVKEPDIGHVGSIAPPRNEAVIDPMEEEKNISDIFSEKNLEISGNVAFDVDKNVADIIADDESDESSEVFEGPARRPRVVDGEEKSEREPRRRKVKKSSTKLVLDFKEDMGDTGPIIDKIESILIEGNIRPNHCMRMERGGVLVGFNNVTQRNIGARLIRNSEWFKSVGKLGYIGQKTSFQIMVKHVPNEHARNELEKLEGVTRVVHLKYGRAILFVDTIEKAEHIVSRPIRLQNCLLTGKHYVRQPKAYCLTCGSFDHRRCESPPVCFKCGKSGHVSNECKEETKVCMYCGGNHDSRTCSILKERQRRAGENKRQRYADVVRMARQVLPEPKQQIVEEIKEVETPPEFSAEQRQKELIEFATIVASIVARSLNVEIPDDFSQKVSQAASEAIVLLDSRDKNDEVHQVAEQYQGDEGDDYWESKELDENNSVDENGLEIIELANGDIDLGSRDSMEVDKKGGTKRSRSQGSAKPTANTKKVASDYYDHLFCNCGRQVSRNGGWARHLKISTDHYIKCQRCSFASESYSRAVKHDCRQHGQNSSQ